MKPATKFGMVLRLVLAGAAFFLWSCRGQVSSEPPLWIKHGMEFQPRYNAFEENTHFADGRNMRMPPEGTVARGLLKEDNIYYRGGDSVAFAAKSPVPLSLPLLERGRERFDIYCAPCHGRTGIGDGMVVQKGFLPPPNLSSDRIVELPDGGIFSNISIGVRNMPAYGKQIPEADRWAIVAYIRALQRSQHGKAEDVPEAERANLR